MPRCWSWKIGAVSSGWEKDSLDGVEADILFRTPGMHPGNPAIQALRAGGAQVTSEMEVFFEVCPCPDHRCDGL